MDLPFTTDYAKSSRAVCRGCHDKIMKNSLRLAIMLQSATFDGKVPNWFHLPCFFIEHMPGSISDIHNFYGLKAQDRKQIENIIRKGEVDYDEKEAKNMVKVNASKVTANCYLINYARSSNNSCQVCADKIKKDMVMITDAKLKSNKLKFHVECFSEFRSDIGFLESADKLEGFDKLALEDQEEVNGLIKNICNSLTPSQRTTISVCSPPKKQKLEGDVIVLSDDDDEIDSSNKESEDDMNLMHEYRELLERLTDQQLKTLLRHNKQKIHKGRSNILDATSEMLTFGGLTKCPSCYRGSLQPTNFGYQCTGMRNSWSKCNFITKETVRTPVAIPETLKILFDFLMVYDFVPRQRKTCESTENSQVLVYQKNQPLKTLNFAVIGFPPDEETKICKQIKYLGGRVVTHIKRSVLAVVTIKEEFQRHGQLLRNAQFCQVYIVPKEYIVDVANVNDKETVLEMIKKYDFSDCGSELHMRIPDKFKRNINRPNFNRGEEGDEEEVRRRKVVIKRGLAIEPDAGLDDIAHVYQIHNNRYTATLSKTDVSSNQNTYYKIQLLEADDNSKYWLFSSWGRIGTNIGAFRKTEQPNLETAINAFEKLFYDKTGYNWSERKFVSNNKKPGKFTYIEVEYDATKEELDLDSFVADATIHPAIAHLVAFIFNVNAMEKVLLEYSLDTQKLPLGKLSKYQVQQAYQVLNDTMAVVKSTKKNMDAIFECTNKFYSLMPHSSALRTPPLLDNKDIINKKLEMLETLYEMETAYSMMKRNTTGEDQSNPLDAYYKQLSTDIDVLDKSSYEYSVIEKYVTNTHGDTHRHYNLEILEVFKVTRHEEPERYSKYNNLHNRKLLWHGSRSTNFAGILAQGLRIAPPEAPSSGYMFGKGIYFADIVSKSANYCCVTETTNKDGLLLLCEVALGNMHEKTRDDSHLSFKTLPRGKHSVKGVGKTQPDHSSTIKLDDGVEVPLGKLVTNVDVKTPLQYNEYIVYDVAQVRARYLLKMKFNFRY